MTKSYVSLLWRTRRAEREIRDRMSQSKPNEEHIIHTICNSHCGGTCEIKVHVSGDRIVRLETGDEEELPHRACARGRAYRQRVYAPDRLLYPLKRMERRGAGKFTRVSWDENTVCIFIV